MRALAAGADALCVGHDLHEEAVESILDAIVAAVGDGRLAHERLEEAAGRVTATAAWASAPTDVGAPGREVGAEAARRALHVRGAPTLDAPPFVVELVPEANVAAGELEHGLAALWPGADGIRVTETAGALSVPDDRPLVLVVRDAARHPWQRELIRRWPEAIVVETGIPGAEAAIETHGAGRVNLAAAIEVLSSPVRASADGVASIEGSSGLLTGSLPSRRRLQTTRTSAG